MYRNVLLCTTAALLIAGQALAQSAPPQANAHREYEQKLQQCRKHASEQGYVGEQAREVIAACMQNP